MRMPDEDALSTAVAWLRCNEGSEGEAERCAAVADWLEHEEQERMVRAAARKCGVTTARFRRKLEELRPMTEHSVFVYGTLKRGFGLHHYLEDATFVGAARTMSRMFMADRGCPMVFDVGPPDARLLPVSGELYYVNDKTRAELDRVEGVPHLYVPIPIRVMMLSTGFVVGAMIYAGANTRDDGKAAPIKDGCYCWTGK